VVLFAAVHMSLPDPGCVKTLKAFVGAQQKNRTCGLSESFMRGRHPIRIYLLPERPTKRFSRSQDPKRTLARPRYFDDGRVIGRTSRM
jgi:hypothetical protein